MKAKRYILQGIVASVALLYACSDNREEFTKNQDADFTVANGRIVFKDAEKALTTFAQFASKSDDELVAWSNAAGFTSLWKTSAQRDSIPSNMPRILAALLNVDHEYQVGRSIVWFHNNNVFTVPDANEKLLQEIKGAPGDDRFANFRQNFMDSLVYGSPAPMQSVEKPLPPASASYSPVFKLTGSHDFRFMRAVYQYWSGGAVGYITEFRSCLQYKSKSNGNWYQAGEPVKSRRVWAPSAWPDAGTTFEAWPATGQIYNSNKQLIVVILSSKKYFEGSVRICIEEQVEYKGSKFSFEDCPVFGTNTWRG